MADRRRPLQVLVVEDDEDMRQALSQMLSALGAEVETAADGELAWHQIQVRQPDLILCDLVMPHLDGLGLMLRLERHPRFSAIPVFAVTGRDEPRDVIATLAAGFRAHLVKPVTMEALSRVLGGVRGAERRHCS